MSDTTRNSTNERRLAELCGLLFDDRISDEQFAELDAILGAGVTARRAYGLMVDTHLDLAERRVAWSSVVAEAGRSGRWADVDQAVIAVLEPAAAARRWSYRWMAAALLLMAGVVAAVFAVSLGGGATDAPPQRRGPVIAVLTTTDEVVWTSEPRMPGDDLAAEDLAIESGRLEMTCHDGSELTLTGPAALALVSGDRIKLDRGRLHVRATPGFTVDAPRFDVVDLGTEFEVVVEGDGAGRLLVWDGRVEVRGDRVTVVDAGDGVHCSAAGAIARFDDAERRAFGLVWGGLRYVRFGFDERAGDRVADTGVGFGGGPFDGRINTDERGGVAKRIDGIIGGALDLGGGAHVESAFAGVGGGAGRTVAFWVRIPVDASLDSSRSIVAWGDPATPGAAWQVEWNYFGPQQTFGTVRLFMGGSQVLTGTTDLRDGRWHHVAVVLAASDESREPDARRDVRLYVDGKPEAITRNSGGLIRTATAPEGKPSGPSTLMIGRDLRGGRASFRGAIDDLYVFDGPLTPAEVVRLMSEKSFTE